MFCAAASRHKADEQMALISSVNLGTNGGKQAKESLDKLKKIANG